MTRYMYAGSGPCRVGSRLVNPGEVIESETNPGRRFHLVVQAGQEGGFYWKSPQHRDIPVITTSAECRVFLENRNLAVNAVGIISTGLLADDVDLSTLEYYTNIGHTIVQCFADQDERLIPVVNGVAVARTNRPAIPSGWPPHWQRFAYQVAGVKSALERCESEYVIRVRNDEHVSNLAPLIDKFRDNTRRLVSSNILWSKEYRTHVGDHVFMGETGLLLATYTALWEAVLAGAPLSVKHPSPECELFKAFVVASRSKYPSSKEKEVVLDRADVVPIHQFGSYKMMNHREDHTFAWTQNNPCPYSLVGDSGELSQTPIALGDEPCRPA